MFSLIRRISSSVIPRPDRPWQDDPTSNAPRAGRKRRLSSTDRDQEMDDEQSRPKKVRSDSVATNEESESIQSHSFTQPPQTNEETEGVKEVTEGVGEVELEDKQRTAPESIPLPDEELDDLDEPALSKTPPPEVHPESSEVSADEKIPTPNVAQSSKPEAGEDLSKDSAEAPSSPKKGERKVLIALEGEAEDTAAAKEASTTDAVPDRKIGKDQEDPITKMNHST